MLDNRRIVRILCLGDVVGAPGRAMVQKHLPSLKARYNVNAVIVNGENSAMDGRGITPRIMKFFRHCGVHVVTSGNHIWQKRDIIPYLRENKDLLRPANFPSECPGTGVAIFEVGAISIAVINVQGRIFMREMLTCPFRAVESLLTYIASKAQVIIVDMHAETTSEKMAMGWFLDGRASLVMGTHTHVQTADERVLPSGTAFITDLGMCGSLNSMIGMKKEPIIRHMITQMPTRFEVEESAPYLLTGVVVEVDANTGKALSIERIRIVDENIRVHEENEPDK